MRGMRQSGWGAGIASAAVATSLFVLGAPAARVVKGAPFPAPDECPAIDYSSPAIERLRSEQQRHYQAYAKFPDVVDVGPAVWEDVWEWHIRVLRETPHVLQAGDGRYGLLFRGTLIELRGDAPPDYFGQVMDRP
jgi:hypothetical protein